MDISFGRTAYVGGIGATLLDQIEKSGLSITMTGDGLVCTTSEAIQEFLDEHEGYQVQEFLEKTYEQIKQLNANESLGDVVFVS